MSKFLQRSSLIGLTVLVLATTACSEDVGMSLETADDSQTLAARRPPTLRPLGRYIAEGGFDVGAAEIVGYDRKSKTLFSVNAKLQRIDRIDISDPTNPTFLGAIDVTPFGAAANSVTVSKSGLVAAAIEAPVKQDPGVVAFFDHTGAALASVQVGALPDMITFTPDERFVLTANEGEPNADYTIDPEGSVSIIDISRGVRRLRVGDVRTAHFRRFERASLDPSIRIFGPGASVSQDLEPEYIAVSHDSKTAWVTLQENNALAVVDIRHARVERLVGLGYKDHSHEWNALDPSDRDGAAAIATQPLRGLYMPDSIASYTDCGRSYLVMANEGDAREYETYEEAARVKDLDLDPAAFPNAEALQADAALGRLNVSTASGDGDGDGDYDALYAFGARSFSIRDERGRLVFDSGDWLEQLTSGAYPETFNANSTNNSFDGRSDDKGPEPEGLALGELHGRTYAFVGLERIGGVMVFDISKPQRPTFVQYLNTRDFTGDPAAGTAGDLAPEGLHFISPKDSPTGAALLVVGYETSGSVRIFEFR